MNITKIKRYIEMRSLYNRKIRSLLTEFKNWNGFYKQLLPVLKEIESVLGKRLLGRDFFSVVSKTIEAAFLDYAEKKQVNTNRYIIKGDGIVIYSPNKGRRWITHLTTGKPTLFDIKLYMHLMPERRVVLWGTERKVDDYLVWMAKGFIPKNTILTKNRKESRLYNRPEVKITIPLKRVFPLDKERFVTIGNTKEVDFRINFTRVD